MKKTFTILLLLISIVSYSQNSLKSVSGESLYSWESQQAKVLPNGDLQWAPLAFQLVKGSSVRYIDFEGGNDTNDGLSTSTAWKSFWRRTATATSSSATRPPRT